MRDKSLLWCVRAGNVRAFFSIRPLAKRVAVGCVGHGKEGLYGNNRFDQRGKITGKGMEKTGTQRGAGADNGVSSRGA